MLAQMLISQLQIEIAKLCLQFLGALLVAWLTVKWALSRYKSEKSWDRRLSAYVDAITAIREMKLVAGKWYDQEISDYQVADEKYEEEQSVRYRAARKRLDEALATATLLLSEQDSNILQNLTQHIDNEGSSQSLAENLDKEIGMLNRTLKLITTSGRNALDLS